MAGSQGRTPSSKVRLPSTPRAPNSTGYGGGSSRRRISNEQILASIESLTAVIKEELEKLNKTSSESKELMSSQSRDIASLTRMAHFMGGAIAASPVALTSQSVSPMMSAATNAVVGTIGLIASKATEAIPWVGKAAADAIGVATEFTKQAVSTGVSLGEKLIEVQTRFVQAQAMGSIGLNLSPLTAGLIVPKHGAFMTPDEQVEALNMVATATGRSALRTRDQAKYVVNKMTDLEFGGGITRGEQASFFSTMRESALGKTQQAELGARGGMKYEYDTLSSVIAEGFKAGLQQPMWGEWVKAAESLTSQMEDLSNIGIPLQDQNFTDVMSQAYEKYDMTIQQAARFTAQFAQALRPSTPQQVIFGLEAVGYQGGGIEQYAKARAELENPFMAPFGGDPASVKLLSAYQNMPGGKMALMQMMQGAGMSWASIYKYMKQPLDMNTLDEIQKNISQKETIMTEGMGKRASKIYEEYGQEFYYRSAVVRHLYKIADSTAGMVAYLQDTQIKALDGIIDAINNLKDLGQPYKGHVVPKVLRVNNPQKKGKIVVGPGGITTQLPGTTTAIQGADTGGGFGGTPITGTSGKN